MLQIQDHSLRPLTTAHLAQTMSLLALSNLELRDKVMAELAENPALELLEERVCPSCHRKLTGDAPCPVCSLQTGVEEAIVFLSPRDSATSPGMSAPSGDQPEQDLAAPEDLALNMLQQLASDLLPSDRYLAAYVLSSLDEDGFLQDPPAIIARTTRSDLSQVQRVLGLISHADPPGLATAGPRDALLVQLDLFDAEDAVTQLARRILTEAFAELGRREFDRIAHRLEVSVKKVRQAATFIQENLNPYPARAFWGSGRQPQEADPNVYHNPDIQVSQNAANGGSQLVVEIFAPVSGWLRVNPMFREAMTEKTEDVSDEWSRHIERASLFVKCMQQRNNTMRRLMELLTCEQREFILHGDRHLKPMTRARLAEKIGVHESTISRAVAHKSIGLPDGRIIPLNRFFDRSLSVRDRIREIIAEEPKPLTDDEIVEILKRDGIQVARRTVAKYRAIEGILPARLRHRKAARAARI
jgi:RNA polymerase sigma-54 factor